MKQNTRQEKYIRKYTEQLVYFTLVIHLKKYIFREKSYFNFISVPFKVLLFVANTNVPFKCKRNRAPKMAFLGQMKIYYCQMVQIYRSFFFLKSPKKKYSYSLSMT